ncbi:hypothetical protein [Nocardia cyriacigeorgica]|uniref:hypothetical protein n=1 Tax=Nocardia cyriacigeorgica TaxID=135487 RepID=UPI0018960E49|nr:hypothetical protein [Nocardia cyriacigeorgica]
MSSSQNAADAQNAHDDVNTHNGDAGTRGTNLDPSTGGPDAASRGAASHGESDDVASRGAGESDEPEPGLNPSRREAHYRTQRNEARQEVERLAGVVAEREAVIERLQREAVEALLGDRIGRKAFWALTDLSDLVDSETGSVDTEKVAEAIAQVGEELGLGPRTPEPNPHLGRSGGPRPASGWVNAFKP